MYSADISSGQGLRSASKTAAATESRSLRGIRAAGDDQQVQIADRLGKAAERERAVQIYAEQISRQPGLPDVRDRASCARTGAESVSKPQKCISAPSLIGRTAKAHRCAVLPISEPFCINGRKSIRTAERSRGLLFVAAEQLPRQTQPFLRRKGGVEGVGVRFLHKIHLRGRIDAVIPSR